MQTLLKVLLNDESINCGCVVNLEGYLWEGSRTCSPPYEASPQLKGQSDENWL